MKIRKVVLVFMMGILILTACTGGQKIQERTTKAEEAMPVYVVKNYVERANIQKRQRLFDDPAQVSWIYCLGLNGQVVFYGPVLGKVTSSNKRLEPLTTVGCTGDACYSSKASVFDKQYTTERIQADGTFGHSDNYVFWFDPANNYYQWDGTYFLTSIPIKIKESVLNVRDTGDKQ